MKTEEQQAHYCVIIWRDQLPAAFEGNIVKPVRYLHEADWFENPTAAYERLNDWHVSLPTILKLSEQNKPSFKAMLITDYMRWLQQHAMHGEHSRRFKM